MSEIAPYARLETSFGPHLAMVCARTAQALQASGFDSLLLHSGSLLPVFQDDRTYPFEPHAPFKVWAPLADAPDSFIFFEPGRQPRLLVNSPADYWFQPPARPHDYWTAEFDIQLIGARADGRACLPTDLGRVAYIGYEFPELAGWGIGAINPAPLLRRLEFERAVKTAYELECLREANRLGARGHVAARQAFEAGATEFEIELAFLRGSGLREQELPYNPIIAMNEGCAVLHYQVLARNLPQQRYSLLIDAGAEFGGYASDITRTYSHGSNDFAELVLRMDGLQRTLSAGVRSGVDWRDVHSRAHELVSQLLRDSDIISCGAEEAVATGISSVFLPHGVGHLLGLEVHDVGGFMADAEGAEIPRPPGHPYLRLTRTLRPGFVVTMEPGLYFIEPLLAAARADERASRINWDRVAQLKRFGGIRIEDDLAVTATGSENLTRDAFDYVSLG